MNASDDGGGARAGAADVPAGCAAVEHELRRVEESATYCAQSQIEQAGQWRLMNLALGVPASVLAAVAGATALTGTTGRSFSGVLALVAAVLGAAQTTVNAAHRSGHALSAANEYLGIQAAARRIRLVDLPTKPPAEARAALADLTRRLDEQNRVADAPTRRSYRRGRRNIEVQRQRYVADEDRRTPGTPSRTTEAAHRGVPGRRTGDASGMAGWAHGPDRGHRPGR